jgi:uncharacterized protein (TIGR03066 family)
VAQFGPATAEHNSGDSSPRAAAASAVHLCPDPAEVRMRSLVGVTVALLALALTTLAGEIEGEKLIGAWELTKVEGQARAPHWRIEFGKGGKLRMTSKREGKEYKVGGTHAVKGDKLTLTAVADGKAVDTRAVTIQKLTGETLVFLDNNKRMEFRRVK